MNRPMYYTLNGHTPVPCKNVEQWARINARSDINRQVAATHINNYYVSTVFLGMDHNFGGGAPLLFETMIFDKDGNGAKDLYSCRYSTWDEAKQGHARALQYVVDGGLK